MAHRAGARIVNAEYIQFHPTTLASPGAQGFLISEAVRGEGGVLLTPDGKRFMQKYDPQWAELAPRDVVARAIHHEMESNGYPYVLLDIANHMTPDRIRNRFPTIHAECLRVGIDITHEPIPVVPAVHYSCGGVAVNEWGESTIAHLYAVGEVACTGLHGANRLASTSLLEGLVFGERAAEHILTRLADATYPDPHSIPPWDESGLTHESDPALIQGDMQTIQNIMWHYVGLIRSGDRLSRAIRELRHLQNEIETFYRKTKLSDGLIGLRNAVENGLIIAQAARHNRQSRGCHYRTDAVDSGERLI
jgi:L-aspartate oxidase